MVKWISAQNPESSIGNAISSAARSLWGDTLTPALKREQLFALQRENAGTKGLMDAFGAWGDAASTYTRPGGPGSYAASPLAAMADPVTSGRLTDTTAQPLTFGTEPLFDAPSPLRYGYVGKDGLRQGIFDTAAAVGADPVDLATVMGYETGGTFDPMQPGPTTKWGTHEGLLQFGDPQAQKYGATFDNYYDSLNSQLGPDGAVAKYLVDSGYQPGMPLADLYSTVNAGAPGRYGASDAGAGGAPGNVGDKVAGMGGHADIARAFLQPQYLPGATASPMTGAPAAGPGEYNPMNAGQMFGELAMRAIESGTKPGDLADLVRMFSANTFGAENQATTDAFVGAGGDYGKTYSGFAADQNRQETNSVRDSGVAMRGQDMDYSLGVYKDENDIVEVLRDGVPTQVRKADMLPTDQAVISDVESKALTARNMDLTDEQKLAYIGAEPKTPPQADGYYSATTGVVHRSVDGATDMATGAPLPPDAVKTSVVSADRMGAGLTKKNAGDTEAAILSGEMFKGTVGRAREAAKAAGPSAFGIVGTLRSLGQDAKAAIDSSAPLFGKEIEQTVRSTEADLRDLAASGDTVANAFFAEYDPNLTSLQMYARLLPYEAAMAIAGQEGRGLSDADVKRFQAIVGDPLSFWGSQQAFMTTLDTIETEVDARLEANRKALGGGIDALTTLPTGGPTVGTVEDGYRFKGGDPSDPASWEPVQ